MPSPFVVTIEAKVVGRRTPLVTDWHVPIPEPATGSLTLRDLLGHVVRREVQAYRQRQEERRLVQVFSAEQLQAAVARGKIDLGGPREAQAETGVDEEAAVATALQAFEDGLYFVFLDGSQQFELDAAVQLQPESTLTFIRLVALAGG
jgi:hypothetical protein